MLNSTRRIVQTSHPTVRQRSIVVGSCRRPCFLRDEARQGSQLLDPRGFAQGQRINCRLSPRPKSGRADADRYSTTDVFERVWTKCRRCGDQARLPERSAVVHGPGVPRIRVRNDRFLSENDK